MPSHDVKLRNRTPRSGTTPNATKTSRAGSAIHATEPLRPPVEVRAPRPRRGGRSERGHCPMTWFMLSANCCGVIDSWKSLAMLSSSFSAAVGLRAWSQDWAKTLALLAVS